MTDQQIEIKRLYLLGIQNKSISKIIGLTLNQVNRIIYTELGLQSKNKKLSMNEVNEVKNLYQKGIKRKKIQDILQIDKARLNHILRNRKAA